MEPPRQPGGFSFENSQRNAMLEKLGLKAPVAVKTGTTISGIIFKDGVMLGADTRATEGPVVADKNCAKIHYIAPNIYCCGAGTAADTENVTNMISSQMELHTLNTNRKQGRIVTALTLLKQYLFRYEGHVSAALVLGGVDHDGAHLYTIAPHGSTDKLPYVTMGSGSLAAMAVFEARWRPDLDFEQAKELVADSIRAGIFNDLGSGSNVDLTAIMLDGTVKVMRNYQTPNAKPPIHLNYTFPRGSTAVLTETRTAIRPLREIVHVETVDAMEA